MILFPKLLDEIMKHLVQGPDGLKEAMKSLKVNKSFYSAAISSPIYVDLSSYKLRVTNDEIFKIVQLFPNSRLMKLEKCNRITDKVLQYLAPLLPKLT